MYMVLLKFTDLIVSMEYSSYKSPHFEFLIMKEFYSQDSCIAGVDDGESFNFKCSYCKRNLSSRQNLREHIYIHTGERPYVCDESGCGLTFRQGSLYSIHRRSHKQERKELKLHKKHFEVHYRYPKLSSLITTTYNNIHFHLQDFEKKEWIEKIEPTTFEFVKNFL